MSVKRTMTGRLCSVRKLRAAHGKADELIAGREDGHAPAIRAVPQGWRTILVPDTSRTPAPRCDLQRQVAVFFQHFVASITDASLARCRRSWPISETAALSGTVRFRTGLGALSEKQLPTFSDAG